MHDSMKYDLMQGQDHEPFKVGNSAVLKAIFSSVIYKGSWQVTMES